MKKAKTPNQVKYGVHSSKIISTGRDKKEMEKRQAEESRKKWEKKDG